MALAHSYSSDELNAIAAAAAAIGTGAGPSKETKEVSPKNADSTKGEEQEKAYEPPNHGHSTNFHLSGRESVSLSLEYVPRTIDLDDGQDAEAEKERRKRQALAAHGPGVVLPVFLSDFCVLFRQVRWCWCM